MRLVFFGTPADAVPPLRALVDAGHDVCLVVTQPDRRRGRGAGRAPSPVKDAAVALGIPVLTPAKSREVVEDVAATGAELGVVVAFGQLLPKSLLASLPAGFVNLHFSLLPRWRGAAPVERALLAGDRETGVCLMQIDEGLDTGPVYARVTVPIEHDATGGSLRAELVARGTQLLVDHLDAVPTTTPSPQAGAPTYADKLTPEDFHLDAAQPAEQLARIVRAGDPSPGAWLAAGGHRFKVFAPSVDRAARTTEGVLGDAGLGTVDGCLVLGEIQPEGKRRMRWQEWRAGRPGDLTVDR